METEQGTKNCSTCGKVLPLDQFYNSTNSKDGKQYQCKQCMSRRNHDNVIHDDVKSGLEQFSPRQLMQELNAEDIRESLNTYRKFK